jgi:hypothetical protein
MKTHVLPSGVPTSDQRMVSYSGWPSIKVPPQNLLDHKVGKGVDRGIRAQKMVQYTSKEEEISLAGEMVMAEIHSDFPAPHHHT